MSATEHLFRTSAFGGFNRYDVMAYLEHAAKVHTKQMEALQTACDEAVQGRDEAIRARDEAEARLNQLSGQEAQASAAQLQLTDELARTKGELEETRSRIERAEQARAQLETRIEAQAADAAAYQLLKERTATIELEAHSQAQKILDDAMEQVKTIRTRMEQWVHRMEVRYDYLHADVRDTASHALEHLEQMQKSLGRVTGEFDGHTTALKDLVRACSEEPAAPVPPPTPLPEREAPG